uniref:Putative ovule protein n=1 Tax=Solanum chacoense TaxID=4108 RepID=A0A0V0GKW8_SOLCH
MCGLCRHSPLYPPSSPLQRSPSPSLHRLCTGHPPRFLLSHLFRCLPPQTSSASPPFSMLKMPLYLTPLLRP